MNKEDGKITIHKKTAISAGKLFERKSDSLYIQEWTTLLAKSQAESKNLKEKSVILFRLGKEWLAFPALYLSEIIEKRPVHRIPHKVDSLIKGVVNLKGQLRLCVSMKELLEIKEYKVKKINPVSYDRMLAIQSDGQQWIFPVDEVFGIHYFNESQIENVPVTVAKSTFNFLKGVIVWKDISVGYLDQELIFSVLQRSL